MMNDLISRSALLEEYEWLKSQVNPSSVPEIEEHIERIKKAPAVDAVPVVRCRDCKRREIDSVCEHFDDDDFCSRGERKDK